MPIQNNVASNELAMIKCDRPDLHGKLIDDLPHQCRRNEVGKNRRGGAVYKNTITCVFPKCKVIFKNARQFYRHHKTVHASEVDQKLDCTAEGCHRTGEEGFSRKDNLIQHLRSVHGEEIPKNLVRFNGSVDWFQRGGKRHIVKVAPRDEQLGG